jgi:glycolate oxidase iron-sulfur subunit
MATSLPVVPAAQQAPARVGDLDYERFMDCVHCGLCLSSCPTYVETGNENDSPRGRIYLWRAVVDGRAELSPEVRQHLDLCLECRGCETACPSGVQYGRIISSFKKEMAGRGQAVPRLGALRRWLLFGLTPYARRMRWALGPLRLLQRLRLRGAFDHLGSFLPRSLRSLQEIVPRLAPHYGRLPDVLPAGGVDAPTPGVLPVVGGGPRRARVGLLIGCAADAFFPQTTLATVKVLRRNGCEVWVPRAQVCCGALHYHAGLVGRAQQFAAANCAAFAKGLEEGLDAIITNAGGCGPVLKEYGHVLEGTPHAEAGAKFQAKVRDVHEFLAALGPVKPTHPLPIRATYHDACGLSHAQNIRQAPRELLGLIPGMELVPLGESEMCCGAAGSYNITQPEMAHAVGERKAQNILQTGARAVFTGNVGCLLQIARHLRAHKAKVWVAHPVEALWASYSGEVPAELRSVLPSDSRSVKESKSDGD